MRGVLTGLRNFDIIERAMKGIARLEALAARMLEGAFRRLPGYRLEPVQIARRLVRAMEDGRTIAAEKVWVPNEYHVYLHPDTLAAFAGFQDELQAELAAYVEQEAERQGFSFIGRPHVSLEPDETLTRRSLRVTARMSGAPSEIAPQDTQALPVEALQAAAQTFEASYRLLLGGRVIPLDATPVSLGRSLDNDVILEDPTVSRRHAQITYRHGRLVLRDLNSRYGTFVNGRRVVEECILRPGDVITLGNVTLKLERGEAG